jgi:single-stranded-DNA-specific exonuclease
MTKLTKEAVREILSARFATDLHTKLSLIPQPFALKDIEKAARRIKQAIDENERIAIVGDYDVDGVVASVILGEFFDDLGVEYELYIPNRFTDGYGLNPDIARRVQSDLIITVDNGISAVEAAEVCKELGITLIITDHHTPPPILPDAYAIVDPKQSDCPFPSQEICGAQVAWYLAAALKEVMGIEYDLGRFLDLLAVAIIADMMDLVDINRAMAKSGLRLLNRSNRPAFAAIREAYKKEKFESEDVSFLISPLLNSSGRMEDALFSYGFLRSPSRAEAHSRLDEIIAINERRKAQEHELLSATLPLVREQDGIIAVWGEGWHEGVIGIVASRLAKRFHRPAIVFSITDGRAKGSARSVPGIDILSLIAAQKELLLGFGGHFGAAGVSLECANLEAFRERIVADATQLHPDIHMPHDDSLGELNPDDVDFELLEILEEFEPYGQKNPKPTFTLTNMQVKIDKSMGRENRHKKFILHYDEGKSIEALYFNCAQDVRRGDVIDIVGSVSKNSFRGLITPQLVIREIVNIR